MCLIQDILPFSMENQYKKQEPRQSDCILAFRGEEILVKRGAQAEYMTYGGFAAWCRAKGQKIPPQVYLFTVGACAYFLTELPGELADAITDTHAIADAVQEGTAQAPADTYEFVRMFAMRRRKPKEQVFAAATAWHLFCWYRDNRYCGRCGGRLAHSERLRMLFCPCCGNQVFPKIAPAVIVGVMRGEYLLMTKYANRTYKRYALIAGFTEIGETAEETVRREVLEEVGLRVKNIRYYKSQPWGFDSDLLLGYFCELDDTRDICIDAEELAEAEWVHYSAIPDDVEGLSLTQEMMGIFREKKGAVWQP